MKSSPPGAGRDRLKALEDFTVGDLEAVRLILRGDSVIDWHRLNFTSEAEMREFLIAQEIHPESPSDLERMETIKREAIGYLRRQFDYPIPRPVERASVPELLMLACTRGHRQTCACTILKCIHIIHHLEGRELLFTLPLSDQEMFQIVEEKVYRVIGSMLAGGFPIVEFVGGRKNRDSLYTKLLSKQQTLAAQIYDKLRFRIVTRSKADVFPVVQYLTKRLFPFNYVVPGESINSVFHLKTYCESSPHLRSMLHQMQAGPDDDFTPSDNTFSAENYRIIHFVVDMPVRLPRRILESAPEAARKFGPIFFVIVEFQLVDQETESANEVGEASHSKYKERQKRAVMRRLQLGMKEDSLKHPSSAPPPPHSSHPVHSVHPASAPAPPAVRPSEPRAATAHATGSQPRVSTDAAPISRRNSHAPPPPGETPKRRRGEK